MQFDSLTWILSGGIHTRNEEKLTWVITTHKGCDTGSFLQVFPTAADQLVMVGQGECRQGLALLAVQFPDIAYGRTRGGVVGAFGFEARGDHCGVVVILFE